MKLRGFASIVATFEVLEDGDDEMAGQIAGLLSYKLRGVLHDDLPDLDRSALVIRPAATYPTGTIGEALEWRWDGYPYADTVRAIIARVTKLVTVRGVPVVSDDVAFNDVRDAEFGNAYTVTLTLYIYERRPTTETGS